MKKLIVGLGNPGPKYTGTRHNAGYMVITRLAKEWGVTAKFEPKLASMVGEARLDGQKVVLAEPTTFMNLSGEAVAKLLNWYKLTPEDMVVVYDELAIPLGTVRVRPDGSAAGHNGIKSIIQHVGHQKWDRVRVGVGPMPPGWKMADFVLGKFAPGEQKALEEGLTLATEATVCVVRHGVDPAMAAYNGLKPAL